MSELLERYNRIKAAKEGGATSVADPAERYKQIKYASDPEYRAKVDAEEEARRQAETRRREESAQREWQDQADAAAEATKAAKSEQTKSWFERLGADAWNVLKYAPPVITANLISGGKIWDDASANAEKAHEKYAEAAKSTGAAKEVSDFYEQYPTIERYLDAVDLRNKTADLQKSYTEEAGKAAWENIKNNYEDLPVFFNGRKYYDTGNSEAAGLDYADFMKWKQTAPSDAWSDEEKYRYAYLKENGGDWETYARGLNLDYASESREKEKKEREEFASTPVGGVLTTAESVVLGGLYGLGDYLNQLIYPGMKDYNEHLSLFDANQAGVSKIASDLNEAGGTINENVPIFGGKGLGDAYQLGNSILQSALVGWATGGAGNVGKVLTFINFFGQASAAGINEAKAKGATDEEALAYGTLAGVFEGLFEEISLDKVIKINESPAGLKEIIKNSLKSAGIEASEEAATTMANKISDAIILGEKSDLAKETLLKNIEDIIFDAVGGAVSGGVHSAAFMGANYVSENSQKGSAIKSSGSADMLEKYARQYGTLKDGKNMPKTNVGLGSLATKTEKKMLEDFGKNIGLETSAISALTDGYKTQYDVSEYAEEFLKYYDAGKNGAEMPNIDGIMGKDLGKIAYNEGRIAAIEEEKTAETRIEGVKNLFAYSDGERASIESNKNFSVAKSLDDILNFVNAQKSNIENNAKTLFVGKISKKTSEFVKSQTGISIENKSIALNGYDIRHIINRHGNQSTENLRGQVAIETSDFKTIIETITDPDRVTANKNEKGGVTALTFQKEMSGKTTAVTVLSEKKNTLTLKTAWINKNGRHISQTTNAEALISTPEARPSMNTVHNDIIPENGKNVKENSKIFKAGNIGDAFKGESRDVYESGNAGSADYSAAFSEAYINGYLGRGAGTSFDSVRAKYGADVISDAQIDEAYQAGADDRNAERGEIRRGSGKVELNGAKVTSEEHEMLKELAAFGKIDIKFADLEGANGTYKDGVIYIDKNAENPVAVVLGHEGYHRFREAAPAQAQIIERIAYEAAEKKDPDIAEKTIARYAEAGQIITYADAIEEIAADYVGDAIGTPENFRQIIKQAQTQKQKNAVARLFDKIRETWSRVKAKFTGEKYEKTVSDADKAIAALEKMMYSAKIGIDTEAVSASEGGEKYSLRKEFSAEFDKWMKDKPHDKRITDGGYFKVGTTSDTLKKIGVRDNNIYWRKQKIQAIMDDHPEITGGIIKDVPSIVERPVIVMKSQTVGSSIVMFGEVMSVKGPVMASVELTPISAGGLEAEFNLITSAYGRTKTNAKNLIENSEVLYLAEKNRVDTLLMSLGVQFPSDQQAYDSVIGSISYSNGNVNISGKKIFTKSGKLSLKEKNTEYLKAVEAGDMDTAQRMVGEAAKESGVALNDKGRPLHLYHGTNRFGFTEFNTPGIFVTSDIDIAQGYGKNGWAEKRKISDAHKDGAGLIRNYNAAMSGRTKIREITASDSVNEIKNFHDAAEEMAKKANDTWTGSAVDTLEELIEKGVIPNNVGNTDFDSALAYVLGLPGTVSESLDYALERGESDEEIVHLAKEDILNATEQYKKYYEKIREVFSDNINELKGTPAEAMGKLIRGYDFGDFGIDVLYKLGHALDADNAFITENGRYVSKESAEAYVEQYKEIGSYDLFGYLGDNPLVIDAKGRPFTNIVVPEFETGNYGWGTGAISQEAQKRGYTSVVIKDVFDVAMNNYTLNKKGDVYIFFDSNQLKSADPVTYDDDGNVIPLSERFNTENKDIRYSLKTTDAEKRVAELAEELERMRQSWSENGEFTGSLLPSETQLKKTVDVLMDGYSGEKTKKALTAELKELFGDIRKYRDAKTTGYKDKLWKAISPKIDRIAADLCNGRIAAEEGESGLYLYNENMPRAVLAQKFELMYSLFEMPNFVAADFKDGTNVNKLYEKIKELRAEKEAALEKVREQRRKTVKALKLAETTDADIDQKFYESEARKKLLRVAKRLSSIKYVNREMTVEGQKVNVGDFIDRAIHDVLDSVKSIRELDLVSVSMRSSTKEFLEDLSSWYSEQKNDANFYGDDRTEKELARLSKMSIGQMTIRDVEALTDALLNVENTIRTQNKMIDSEDKRNFQEQGAVVINDVSHLAGINKGLWDDIVTESLSPLRAVSRITGYNDGDPLMMRTRELNDGQRNMLAWIVKYKTMFNEYTSDTAYMKTLTGKNADIVMRSGDGIMTRGMLMSLYLHSTNAQNMKHVELGGAVLPNGELYKEGKIRDAYAKKTILKMSRSQIVKLANEQLDEKDFKFIAAVKRYFNIEAKAGINEVSNKLLGYDLAKVGEYFPISVNGAFTKAEYEQIKCDGSVAGMGNLKERVDSSLPIDLVDVTTVLNRAIDLNAKYIGLAVPVRNMSKLLRIAKVQSGTDANGATVLEKVLGGDGFEHYIYDTSVMDAIEKKWGKNGADYIKNMLADVQGLNIKDRNTFTDLFDGLRSNYAQAVLTINPAVALKQTASYPTAAAVIGWKALLKGLDAKRHVNLDVVSKYTPLLAYRSLGYTDADLGAIVNRRGRLPKGLNWIQFMDVLTTKRLWAACEYYIEEHKPSLERRSDEYYKAVAEVYNRVIEETQPNYTAMQRPQLLRSNDTLLKNLAMFKTQPMQNLNLIFDAIGNYRAKNAMYTQNPTAENSAALKEAKARFGRVISSQIVQAVMMAAITLGWNAARGKLGRYKDEDDETIFNGKGFARFIIDVVENLGSGIPFASEVTSFAEAIAGIFSEGKFTYYGIEAATPAMISDMVSGIGNFLVQLTRVVEGNAKTEKVISATENAASEIAKVFGIPVGNVINMMKIVFRIFGVEWDK